ncbi:hypothetical protein [[Clostridium] hylemonae]
MKACPTKAIKRGKGGCHEKTHEKS